MTDSAALLASIPTGLWIDGAFVDAADGCTFAVHDPATGDVLARVADAGEKDALRALDSAVAVQDEGRH